MASSTTVGHGLRDIARGLRRLLSSTNHQDIGALYIIFGALGGIIAFLFSIGMRPEMTFPGVQIFPSLAQTMFGADPSIALEPGKNLYSIAIHGVLMVLYMAMPILIGGFGNWFAPTMIGAPDMAFPRLNKMSFQLLVASLAFAMLSMFAEGPRELAVDLLITALLLAGASSLLGAVNFVTTIVNMRAPGVSWGRMPLFVWSILLTAFLLILVLPVLAGCATLLLTDRHFGAFFAGGDPQLFQQLLWFFGHPEVYVIILPAFGVISQVISTFSQRPLFGALGMVYATMCIGALGAIVWVHHVYALDKSFDPQRYFVLATMLIAAPAGVKIFSWIATLWGGVITLRTPLFWAMGFIFMFMLGGVTGVVMANASLARPLHEGYSLLAQFHYTLSLSAVFAIFSGFYYWFPKMTGYMYSETLGRLNFWMMFAGVNIIFFPQHFLGLVGAPRHYVDYPEAYAQWTLVSSMGMILVTGAVAVWFFAIVEAFAKKRVAGENPWGVGATTLEWTPPSLAPLHPLTPSLRISSISLT